MLVNVVRCLSPRIDVQQSPRYSGWGLPGANQNLFAELNIQRHAERRRQTAGIYNMNALTKMEHRIDQTEVTFFEKMTSFAGIGELFEINQWLHYFAFDVIGENRCMQDLSCHSIQSD